MRQGHTNKVYKMAIKPALMYTVQNVGQLERRGRGNCTQLKCACLCGQEESDDYRVRKLCIHLERGTHVPDGRIPQREEVDMVWTCGKAGLR